MNKLSISNLIPLNALSANNLERVTEQAKLESHPANTQLFHEGDLDVDSLYLLSGEVTLSNSHSKKPRHIVAGTDTARHALAQLKPRQYSGLALTPVGTMRINDQLIDRLLSWDQVTTSYEVTEFDSSDEFQLMMRLLNSEIFHQLPPANANVLFKRFKPYRVKAGQIVIRQGDPGDYFYFIEAGAADVVYKQEKEHHVSIIGHIKEGEGFGEDALLTGAPRNATVVMKTEGILLRLGKKDFDELLREPLVSMVTLEETRSMVKAGAILLDVRLEDEYIHGTIKGSTNIPLYKLRKLAANLDPRRHYILFCQSGSRSSAAAFILTERGFQVSVLSGGLEVLRPSNS